MTKGDRSQATRELSTGGGAVRSTIALPGFDQDVHLLLKGKPPRHSALQASVWLAKMYLTLQVDRFSRRNLAQEVLLFISRCCYRKRDQKELQPAPGLITIEPYAVNKKLS